MPLKSEYGVSTHLWHRLWALVPGWFSRFLKSCVGQRRGPRHVGRFWLQAVIPTVSHSNFSLHWERRFFIHHKEWSLIDGICWFIYSKPYTFGSRWESLLHSVVGDIYNIIHVFPLLSFGRSGGTTVRELNLALFLDRTFRRSPKTCGLFMTVTLTKIEQPCWQILGVIVYK